MILLGVNIDHIATLREARKEGDPDVIKAAEIAEANGADQITIHLREDRRHIQDRDVQTLRQIVKTRLNLEMAVEREIIDIAKKIKPDTATFVPEKREEVTTEGGLDIIGRENDIKSAVSELTAAGIEVSLFIDPDIKQIDAAVRVGAKEVEFHTGQYSCAETKEQQGQELKKLKASVDYAVDNKLVVKAGHGLNYDNVKAVSEIKGLKELNIGHSIVCRSIFTGLADAVSEMRGLINE